ncbi:MAG: DsbA family protein [Treponema sp.]|jgi:predicted DsbA family dithiol-disulfide isomerase|nr:DsbA family protein [Treponema sp.]
MPIVQIFYDYECPFCKRGYEYLLECLGDFPGVEIEFRPIESHPRPEDHPPHTDLACAAYYAARELGADMGKFHTAMFQAVAVERRNVEKPEVLAEIAGGLLDEGKFKAILESGAYSKQVEENNDLAYEKSGVWFVPAFRYTGADGVVQKLDAEGGAGITRDGLRAFLELS